MARKTYTLTPLSPVHIGTGEELTPLDYKVAALSSSGEKKYWKFSNDRIIQRLIDDGNKKEMKSFEQISEQGTMKELQRFFQANCTTESDIDYICEITERIKKTYNENRGKDPMQNAEIVLQMYRTPGRASRPIIPGSSLKGSIRTALLNMFLAKLPDNVYDRMEENFKRERDASRYDRTLQQQLFQYDDAKNDPLRAVSIPDCSFHPKGTQLVGGLKLVYFSEQAETLEPLGTQIQAEVIRGKLLGGNVSPELCISVNDKLQKANLAQRRDDKPKYLKNISLEDIHASCNWFYWREFEREYEKFYKNVSDGSEEMIVGLKNGLEKARDTPGQFIVRVGRWSQVEFVTLEENFRKPDTKKDRSGRPLGSGKTRTLFDYDGKYVPMGWCVLAEKR